jgi:GT2 family glycosyltransferase
MDSARTQIGALAVIPSINGLHLLQRLLPTVDLPPERILVIDQASVDGTEAWLQAGGFRCHQANRALSFCEAVNIGLRIAQDEGHEFACVINNDTEFCGPVLHDLSNAMQQEPSLGAVAPSQIVLTTDGSSVKSTIYRCRWELDSVNFLHDAEAPPPTVQWLDSDFCEFTCVLLRCSALVKTGLLDEEYGFYYEDADLGFRLREAGYTSAYLPKSQIRHYAGSSFGTSLDNRKLSYIEKNRRLFARKHLGYVVSYFRAPDSEQHSWSVINRQLHSRLTHDGLIGRGPRLAFGHPNVPDSEYLFSVWETTKLPAEWAAQARRYRKVFLPSRFNVQVFRDVKANATYVPLGVDTDIFTPDGQRYKLYEGRSILVFVRNQYRKALDVTLSAWKTVRHELRTDDRLILCGRFLDGVITQTPTRSFKSGKLFIREYDEDQVVLIETLFSLSDQELADLYRSVDATLLNSRSEGFGFTVVESMACGVPAIFPDYSSTADFAHPGALTVSGTPTRADYSDKGDWNDIGHWWEPDLQSVCDRIRLALSLSDGERKTIARAGLSKVRSGFTWRHTSFALRAGLTDVGGRIDITPGPFFASARKPPVTATARYVRKGGTLLTMFADDWLANGLGEASRRLGRLARNKLRRP